MTESMPIPAALPFSGYRDAQDARVRALEIRVQSLTDKVVQLMSGEFTRCAVTSCDNVLMVRAQMGYLTCSGECQRKLRAQYRPRAKA